MGIIDSFLAAFFPAPIPLHAPTFAADFGRMADRAVIDAGSYDQFEDTIQIPGALPEGWTWKTNQQKSTEWWTAPCRRHGEKTCSLLRDGVPVVWANDQRHRFQVTVRGTDQDDTDAIIRIVRELVERGDRALALRRSEARAST